VTVPYAIATNGYGTATAAVGGYSDFWTATTITGNFPAIDPYWTTPAGNTPNDKCGFKSCSLYLPSATGSCRLPTTAGAEPAIPADQAWTAQGIKPASTANAQVSYSAWESYIGDQPIPAWANLSALST